MTELQDATAPTDDATTAPATASTTEPTAPSGDEDAPALTQDELASAVHAIADRARAASRVLAGANRGRKDRVLLAIGEALVARRDAVLAANRTDVERGRAAGTSDYLLDRLTLDAGRIDGLADALAQLAALPDPIGTAVRAETLPNGLRMRQVRVPLGVVAAIYEARPNVTVDIAGLALKSGNSVILRGGSAAQATNAALVGIIRDTLGEHGLPRDAVLTIDEYGRAGAQVLMAARGRVDVLIPRGGRELIQSVVTTARVPVIETGEGNVHILLDASADEEMAVDILLNAKTQRPSVCNTVETLLVHSRSAAAPGVLAALIRGGVTLHVDDRARDLLPAGTEAPAATDDDWGREYMQLDLAVRTVDSVDEALEHIRRWSTGHSEAIITNDLSSSEEFIAGVDSAAVLVNASTRFVDGGELGLGAEVGISTQKMHARGPMGLAELTTTQWIVQGEGQIRR
ncbi:glutamate-5-semialdehyde dehydrogenase [Arthrobacter agilis]|uniref:glutamate-5-semialdehyde dehydrogenase n=1 Tax=Arthrobacter agilis TaxID=37921 RepID=UPI000B3561AC|nr:glutamate-5-semialdehyde dehydrogenase [Arthrobacter agilis]OUM45012.1 glutamate-5-semialdehyde dehydrogenase [Arthrobacter agilis]PPB46923.1 glutamate-5-semialdehyde dehydrogenase [Arthrobacter agilis]TPV23484.1 glutamate-5-semialdehyde dehydrogenase [Arthrobacter agilis]VDR31877.1 Gamma-glutamyl phosphate reductase [Arthrobacter agilis]